MIDLHSHILPGLDDGARDRATAVAMAGIAVDDGIVVMASTPHITPGRYDNDTAVIEQAMADFQAVLDDKQIPLRLVPGADIRVAPGLGQKLASHAWPTIAKSRYFLFEPPHNVLVPRLVELAGELVANGLVPVLTHPERLSWIEKHYSVICALDKAGCAIQLTAGSVTGRFGQRAKYWCDRMLDEDRVDILATDAHNTTTRPPVLSRARDVVAQRIGEEAAERLVVGNPRRILEDQDLPRRSSVNAPSETARPGRPTWREKLTGLIDRGSRRRA